MYICLYYIILYFFTYSVYRKVSIVTKSEINPQGGEEEHFLYIAGSFFNSDSMPLLIIKKKFQLSAQKIVFTNMWVAGNYIS